jgi:hypothetical protein
MKKKIGKQWIGVAILLLGIAIILFVGLILQYTYLGAEQPDGGRGIPYNEYTWKENLLVGAPIIGGMFLFLGGIFTTLALWGD